MIERSERQNAERNAGAGEHAGHGANAAVAAANHHRVDLSGLGALERGLGEQLQLGPAAEFSSATTSSASSAAASSARKPSAPLWLAAPAAAFNRATSLKPLAGSDLG